MSLETELRRILPDVLPTDPAEAIYGVELLEKLRPLVQGYADNSIRQTLSILAADPTSPIARLEERYGYYRRPDVQQVIQPTAPAVTPVAEVPPQPQGRDAQAEEKFRAFFMRYMRLENAFPMKIEHVTAAKQPAGVNKWKFPDVVVLKWETGDVAEAGYRLDASLLEVKRSLGEQPFRVTSVELKTELSLVTFREHFFQCVSNSKWAHSAVLAVAKPISDALLAGELRRLGASYGVAVRSFGLDDGALEALPSASEISTLSDDDFAVHARRATVSTLSPEVTRSALDWEHIRDMKTQSTDFVDLFEWIARCLRDTRAYPYFDFKALRRIESKAG